MSFSLVTPGDDGSERNIHDTHVMFVIRDSSQQSGVLMLRRHVVACAADGEQRLTRELVERRIYYSVMSSGFLKR